MNNIFLIPAIFLIVCIFAYKKYSRFIRRSSISSNSDINKWMEMSNEKRKELLDKYSINTMIRKKNLLKEIRKEYIQKTKFKKKK
tara:strand:+ start:330 stop:584 length:255 start_codon:yes stop_codon:yes gene_type:complete